MTEIFDQNGCLTDGALLALIDGAAADELSRLEIAEHLSFCDRCTGRYAELLCGAPLLETPEPLETPVLQALARQGRVLFFRRYIAAGMAACLALTFWFTGMFSPNYDLADGSYTAAYTVSERMTNKTQELGTKFADGFQSFFDQLSNLDLKGVFQDEKK